MHAFESSEEKSKKEGKNRKKEHEKAFPSKRKMRRKSSEKRCLPLLSAAAHIANLHIPTHTHTYTHGTCRNLSSYEIFVQVR